MCRKIHTRIWSTFQTSLLITSLQTQKQTYSSILSWINYSLMCITSNSLANKVHPRSQVNLQPPREDSSNSNRRYNRCYCFRINLLNMSFTLFCFVPFVFRSALKIWWVNNKIIYNPIWWQILLQYLLTCIYCMYHYIWTTSFQAKGNHPIQRCKQ